MPKFNKGNIIRGAGRLRSRMRLKSIYQMNPFTGEKEALFLQKDNTIKTYNLFFNHKQITEKEVNKLTLTFHTPTRIKDENMILRIPEFSGVVKRLRDRYFALNLFYNEKSDFSDFDHRQFNEQSQKIKISSCNTRFIEQTRKARSQGFQHQDISGFIGKVSNTGNITPFYPLILLGQYFNVGKGLETRG